MATILVVDDRPSNRQFLLTLLGYSGHLLLEAADGAEALRLIRSAHPDLVVTDILMPKMDGYELVTCLRADPELAATRVIFYTATYSAKQAHELAAACGVRTVLPKPSDPERIIATVEEELHPLEGATPPAAPRPSPARPRFVDPVDDTVRMYLRELQGVKVTFDGLVKRSAAFGSDREQIKNLSARFSENVSRLQRITSRLSALIEVGLAMTSERDPERLARVFFAAACDIIDSPIAAVGLLDERESALRYVYTKNVDRDVFGKHGEVPAGLLDSLLSERRVYRGSSVEGLPASHPAVGNILALSIASPERIHGWIYFAAPVGAPKFSDEDEQLAGIMAAELALRYEHTLLYDVIQRHAAELQMEVAERRHTQEALREREAALYRAQTVARLAHVISGSDGEFLQWSETLPPLLGLDAAALPGAAREWLAAIHPEDRASFRRAAIVAAKTGARTEVDYRFKRGSDWMHLRHVFEPLAEHSAGVSAGRWFSTIQDVSEQKRTALAFLESEGRFRQLAENIREVFWLTDTAKQEVLYVSPAYQEIWGRSPQTLGSSARDWLEAIHAEDRARVLEAARTKQASGTYDEEYRITRPDGSVRWIRDRAFPVRDADGVVVRVAGVAEDITERKRATDALHESERRLSDLLRNIELISVMLDCNACITYCNEYLLRLTGWTRKEVFARNWFELFVPPDAVEDTNQAFAQLLQDSPVASHHVNEILTRWGTRRLIQWSNTVMRSSSGEVIGSASIGEDVTERVLMAKAVTEAERKYRSIFENSVDGIFQTTMDGKVISANPAAARMLGYGSPTELIDSVDDLGMRLYAETEHKRGLVAELQAHSVVRDFESGFKRTDGETIWVSLNARLETDQRDGRVYVFGSMRNITDTKLQAQKIERLTRMYAVLSGINAMIVRVGERGDLFRECCRIVVEAGGFSGACVYLLDPLKQQLKAVARTGADNAVSGDSEPGLSLTDDDKDTFAPLAIAIRERRMVVVNDIAAGPGTSQRRGDRDPGLHSLAALPLFVADEAVAVLGLTSADDGYLDDDETRLLHELAGDISYALEHIQRAERLEYLALYDSTTGLANRALFLDRLGQRLRLAAAAGDGMALLLADIERLGTINSSLGRTAGDALLKQLGERLAGVAMRDAVARPSADHFAILLAAANDEADLTRRVETLWQDCLGAPFLIEGSTLRIAARTGIALYPKDGNDPETLLRSAEAALRRAKRTGERHVFHTAEMTARSCESLSLENSLRRALDNNEFVLYYQPKVDLESRRIVGAEALIRWQSPDQGLVLPGRFIPLLEETGLILAVGSWAMHRAMLDRARWKQDGVAGPRIAVNVSASQLRQRDFVEVVKATIAQDNGPAGLDLEVTESMMMEDIERSTKQLKILRDLGVNIAIDDFGTGYSSLAYLAKLPVHALKIDRSFIRAMVDDADVMSLVSTIITMGHSLRLKVIAEGVETEEQAKLLRLVRCDEAQGYLFGRPLPWEELTLLLRVSAQT